MIGSMFLKNIQFDGENYRTNSYNKVLEYIFQETNMLKGQKKEETVNNSVSSVSVPGAGQFTEPFMRDLELIVKVKNQISSI